MKKFLRKIITKKQEGSGLFSILMGTMILFTFLAIIISYMYYSVAIKSVEYIKDGMSASLLGALLINTDEYGASNELVVADPLTDTSYVSFSDIDYVNFNYTSSNPEAIDKYYATYFITGSSLEDGKSNMRAALNEIPCAYGGTSYIDSIFDTYVKLLTTNLGLNSSSSNVYKPWSGNAFLDDTTTVTLNTFKIYNYYEFIIAASDYDREPVVATTSTTLNGKDGSSKFAAQYVYTTSGSKVALSNVTYEYNNAFTADTYGDTIINKTSDDDKTLANYASLSALKSAGVMHRACVVYEAKYNGSTWVISRVGTYVDSELNSLYITDSSGNKVLDVNGNEICMGSLERTVLYSDITFTLSVGSSSYGNNGRTYTYGEVVYAEKSIDKN